MNVGRNKRHPRYICDKCGQAIPYEYRKGIQVNKYYKQANKSSVNYKDFDLCNNCERKFRKWLKEKEVPTVKELIDSFPIWEE